MNSRESSPVLVLFVLLLPVIVMSDVLDNVCSTTPFPDFCVETLRPDPNIPAAQGPVFIAVVMLDYVDASDQKAIPRIDTLINEATDPSLKEVLSSCRKGYETTVTQYLPAARDAFISTVKGPAYNHMVKAVLAADNCQQALRAIGSDVLTAEYNFAHKGAIVCASIAKAFP